MAFSHGKEIAGMFSPESLMRISRGGLRICEDAGVNLIFLPPYSPDLNPIKEFLAELKSFIKRS